jgi:hypothetical protein
MMKVITPVIIDGMPLISGVLMSNIRRGCLTKKSEAALAFAHKSRQSIET